MSEPTPWTDEHSHASGADPFAPWVYASDVADLERVLRRLAAFANDMPMHLMPHTTECLNAGPRCICWQAKRAAALAEFAKMKPK